MPASRWRGASRFVRPARVRLRAPPPAGPAPPLPAPAAQAGDGVRRGERGAGLRAPPGGGGWPQRRRAALQLRLLSVHSVPGEPPSSVSVTPHTTSSVLIQWQVGARGSRPTRAGPPRPQHRRAGAWPQAEPRQVPESERKVGQQSGRDGPAWVPGQWKPAWQVHAGGREAGHKGGRAGCRASQGWGVRELCVGGRGRASTVHAILACTNRARGRNP